MKLYNLHTQEWLCEESLGYYISRIFPDSVNNKQFLNYKFRPDYVSHEHKTVIEYNGDRHYTKADSCIRDLIKMGICHDHGYKFIQFPYFMQITPNILEKLFGNICTNMEQFEYLDFPQGFISKNCVLPADFCTIGIQRFKQDLKYIRENFGENVERDIILSLERRSEIKDIVYHIECYMEDEYNFYLY